MKKATLLIISFALIIIIIGLFNFKFNIKEKFIITYKKAIDPTSSQTVNTPPTIETQKPDLDLSTIVLLNTKKEMDPVDLDPDRVCDDNKKICLVNYKFTFDNQLKYDYQTYFPSPNPQAPNPPAT
jgi:hypothetical protein